MPGCVGEEVLSKQISLDGKVIELLGNLDLSLALPRPGILFSNISFSSTIDYLKTFFPLSCLDREMEGQEKRRTTHFFL